MIVSTCYKILMVFFCCFGVDACQRALIYVFCHGCLFFMCLCVLFRSAKIVYAALSLSIVDGSACEPTPAVFNTVIVSFVRTYS